MSEELGTRDVVEQLDTRLGNLEQGQRDMRGEVVTRFGQLDSRFDKLYAVVLLSWLTLMASIWLKS